MFKYILIKLLSFPFFLAKIHLNSCMTVDLLSSFSLVTNFSLFPQFLTRQTTGHLRIGKLITVYHEYKGDIEVTIETFSGDVFTK